MDNLIPKTYIALRGIKINGTDYYEGDPIPNDVIAKVHNLKTLMRVKWIDLVEGIEPVFTDKPESEDGTGKQATNTILDVVKQAAGAVNQAENNPDDEEKQKATEAAFNAAITELKALSVDKLKDVLQTITDMATLHALLEGEERKTAFEAIKERIAVINSIKEA